MKLYSEPGACSTADHIALPWSGSDFNVRTMDSDDLKSDWYRATNPPGSVPALRDGDFVLTQNAATLGFTADCFPAARLAGDGSAPGSGTLARVVASGVHPAFVPMSHPARFIDDATRHDALKQAART